MSVLLLSIACTKPVPPAPSAETAAVEVATAPDEGWYNSACYASLDGDLDTALDHLARSIETGEAPLDWMQDDPDLVALRADPRWPAVRDGAIDTWVENHPPGTGREWIRVAQARIVQGRDPASAVQEAEDAGYTHAIFDPALPPATPSLQALEARRAAFEEARRGTVVVENPAAFELANIILSQTAYGQDPNATDRESGYAAEVDAWFEPHRDHPLIAELDALPVDIGVYYAFRNQAAAWELTAAGLSPGSVYPAGGFWGGEDPFATRRDPITSYIEATDARSFLDAHSEYYANRIAEYEAEVPIQAMWDWLEAHFPAEGDGRDSLVVRTSPLIGGSHNASTLQMGSFTEGTMVVPISARAESIEPVDVGPLSRMVFTEIDHHYVNPVSNRMKGEIDAALGDHTRFNSQSNGGYANAYLTFNEYATWVLFDVWWAEHCDAVDCPPEVREAGAVNTTRVMKRREFHRYGAFRDALLPKLKGQPDMEALFPEMLVWFASQDAEPE